MAFNVNKLNQSNNYGDKGAKVKRYYSAMNMTHTVQGTGDMGKLIPIYCRELIPGEKASIDTETALQFMPFVSNLLHELNGEITCGFTPNRLVWDKWEEFITGGEDGMSNIPVPTIDLYGKAKALATEGKTLIGTKLDALGMPINFDTTSDTGPETKPIALGIRAMNKFYNDHVRLLDWEEEIDLDNIELQVGNESWNYFNRARKYQQRGIVPTIPVSDELQQLTHDFEQSQLIGGNWSDWEASRESMPLRAMNNLTLRNSEDKGNIEIEGTFGGSAIHSSYRQRLLPHNLDALGMNLNDLLVGMAIMRFEVNNARIQPRYVDQLNSRFGVYPEDARLQRAEYIGTKYFNVTCDTVTQTSESATTPQGNITGQAWGSGQNMKFDYEAKEHGYIYMFMCIKPKPVYEGGLDRMWVKNSKFDFVTPELVNTPDRTIKQYELLYQADEEENQVDFGWQNIYEEYRTNWNIVTGRLRPSGNNDNLKSYTLAQYWTPEEPPVMGKEFYGVYPDKERIMRLLDEPTFIYFVRISKNTAIPLPYQSEPAELATL